MMNIRNFRNAGMALALAAVFFACKDDDDDAPANAISSEEAAVVVASSFASNTSGVSFVAGESAETTEDLLEDNSSGRVAACGVSRNLDLSGSSPDGANMVWSYDFSYKFRLNCNAEEKPESVSVDLSYSGDFDGPKLSAEHSGLSELDITGLEESVEQLLLAGLYKRSGSFEQKEGEMKAGSQSVEITLEDIAIDKQTHNIVSGTGNFSLEGSVPDKGDFRYNGTIEFTGSDAAMLKIAGDTFILNLKTGDVAKQS